MLNHALEKAAPHDTRVPAAWQANGLTDSVLLDRFRDRVVWHEKVVTVKVSGGVRLLWH